ncbi:hypothetical protein [Klebsiella grimontii]|uniref:hypothetical protein n=1 Tax=Klebsiella TaxID=570 RepID=UPI0012B92A99|nr:hypothetical protein [Klebsiella grimontii]
MTTDITELAQSLKAAAEKWQEAWGKYDKVEITIAEFIRAAEQYESIVKDPANILALVEALEKAQTKSVEQGRTSCELFDEVTTLRQRIAELEQQNSIANEKVTELSRLVQHNISRAEDAERRAERISKSSSLSHPGLLHATNELVLIFSHALADKLYAAQEKYNHGTSWRNNDWQEACQRDFQKHIAKGDPRDVAAYCAFMWWHGWSTKPAEGLESRTVTVKLPYYRNTYKGPFADEVEHQVRLALELFSTAAGIKWEAE